MENTIDLLDKVKLDTKITPLEGIFKPLDSKRGLSELSNIIKDTIIHLQDLGSFGGVLALKDHNIQIERLRNHCCDKKLYNVLNYVSTILLHASRLLKRQLSGTDMKDIYEFSSDKVKKLFDILREHKKNSSEELCAIVFVRRRFSAKILYHILKILSDTVCEFSFIKPNFMVGYNSNPFNDTREVTYLNKINKEIVQGFCLKEFNLLVASNVLEEGIDVPKCSLVVKFDLPLDYRSYIQSKGRARHKTSQYYVMVETGISAERFIDKYSSFQEIEAKLNEVIMMICNLYFPKNFYFSMHCINFAGVFFMHQ